MKLTDTKVQTGATTPIFILKNELEELKKFRAEQDRIAKMTPKEQKKIAKASENNQTKSEIKKKKVADENTLKKELMALRNKHLKFLNKAKAIHSSDDAVDIILCYDQRIRQVARKLKMPREMIQATLYRELICLGLDDIVKDGVVMSYYATKKGYGMPGINDIQKVIYEKAGGADSSTGLGQIFAKTAIMAEQSILNNYSLDYTNKDHLWSMWNKLGNDSANIYYVGLILGMEAKNQTIVLPSITDSQIKNVFAAYNGGKAHYQCNAAQRYGTETKQYYDVFKKYQK